MEKNLSVPILIPFEVDKFWAQIREIIREEFILNQREQPVSTSLMETPGLTEKPLYKIQEICALFKISKPTIYEWIMHGKLKRVKIRSKVYFLGRDIRQLMQT